MVTKNWQKNNVIKIINKIERENKIMKTQYKKKLMIRNKLKNIVYIILLERIMKKYIK